MAVFFTIMGTILQWERKLDINYIMLIGVIQALVLGHSIKEDFFSSKLASEAKPEVKTDVKPEGEGDVK
jgi:hypothetical protein